MSVSTARALRVLEDRAQRDPVLAETIRLLASNTEGPDDPFARPKDSARAAARLNSQRSLERSKLRRTRALDTAEVVELLASVRDRKGVDRRRQRGQLLGWREGRRTLHPSWQFDRRNGETYPGIDKVVAALGEVTEDARDADALMTETRPDLDGGTLAELLARGRIETATRLISSSGDQA